MSSIPMLDKTQITRLLSDRRLDTVTHLDRTLRLQLMALAGLPHEARNTNDRTRWCVCGWRVSQPDADAVWLDDQAAQHELLNGVSDA